MRESKILRECLVEEPERVGKVNLLFHIHSSSTTQPPRGTCEITEAIYGNGGGLFKRRDEECGSKVGEVVLDAMYFAAKTFARQDLLQ